VREWRGERGGGRAERGEPEGRGEGVMGKTYIGGNKKFGDDILNEA
jgi:hypothetical protein